MKIVACSLLALGLVGATPVLAQGIHIGPGGVGVDVGPRYRDYDYGRDRDRPYYREDEGRSVYRDRMYRDHREDEDN